ncbi:MAG: copper resistance protein CopC [Mycobacteriales bacterium]
MSADARARRLPVLVRGALAATATAAVAIAVATPAYAHTELVSATPAPQSQQPTAPPSVVLRFSSAVEVQTEAIRVFDPAARRVDSGASRRSAANADTVSVPLAAGLSPGIYTTTWRVVSDDGHPLEGAFTFSVGKSGRQTAATDRSISAPAGSGGLVGMLLSACRWLMYGGLLVLVGGAVFLALLWQPGWADRRAAAVVTGSWLAAVLGTIGGLLLQGPNATGRTVGASFDWALQRDVLTSRYGVVGLSRLALLAVAGCLVLARRRRVLPAPGEWLAAAIGLALLVTPTLTSHAAAAEREVFAVAVDVAHLCALAVWLGGLAMLGVAALRSDSVDPTVVAGFSRLAFACVAGVAVTGAVQSWREVGSLSALTNTRYGSLLMAKVAVFVALLGAAAVSRRWVQRRLPSNATAAALRRSVGAEIVLAAVVLLVATMLTAAPPARTAYAAPFRDELHVASLDVAIEVRPAKAGPVTLDVRTTGAGGAEVAVTFVTIDLRLPAHDIGPLRVRLQRISESHYRASDVDLPLPGRWQLDAEIFVGSGKSRTSSSFDVS